MKDKENLSRGDRTLFGKFFSNQVNENNISGVIKVKKKDNNH